MRQQLSELLRPTELADIIQPPDIIRGLERMVAQRAPINMIFHGKPGLGKTSAAQILARKLNADMMYEINGSLWTGVSHVRQDLEAYVSTLSLTSDIKICLIEECEFLSVNAQAALRRVIEKSTHVRFLMTGNNISKLDRAIRSRCLTISFDVGQLEAEPTIQRLLPRYIEKLGKLGYKNLDAEWLSKEMHLDFPDLRTFANRIAFKYGAPDEERAALFQMERDREAGMACDGHKAA
jgi:replication-associated recombination protein RarA